jgi:Anti-sigma-K factor rskA
VRPALAAIAAVALLAIGAGVGAVLERTPRSSGATVELSALPGVAPRASGRAGLTASGRMMLVIRNLPASRPGTYYEAWLMTDTTRLVPVAAFRADTDSRAQIDVPLPAPAAGYRYIDVSLQRTGAGMAHSGHWVLRGKT